MDRNDTAHHYYIKKARKKKPSLLMAYFLLFYCYLVLVTNIALEHYLIFLKNYR